MKGFRKESVFNREEFAKCVGSSSNDEQIGDMYSRIIPWFEFTHFRFVKKPVVNKFVRESHEKNKLASQNKMKV